MDISPHVTLWCGENSNTPIVNATIMLQRRLIMWCVLVSILLTGVHAARLPEPGSDPDAWGEVLNAFLLTSFDDNGSLLPRSVDGSQIGLETIIAENIAIASITGDRIEEKTINAEEKIMDGSITWHEIADGTVQESSLAPDSVTSEKIVDGSITENDLALGAVDSAAILDDSISWVDISIESITGDRLIDNEISSIKITDGTIQAIDIALETITGDNIEEGTITGDLIAEESINGDHVVDETLTGSDIAGDSELTVASVDAQLFFLSPTEITASCVTLGCTATAVCPDGSTVLFGLYSDASQNCANAPLSCNGYCGVGAVSCGVIASVDQASAYVVCARVQ